MHFVVPVLFLLGGQREKMELVAALRVQPKKVLLHMELFLNNAQLMLNLTLCFSVTLINLLAKPYWLFQAADDKTTSLSRLVGWQL